MHLRSDNPKCVENSQKFVDEMNDIYGPIHDNYMENIFDPSFLQRHSLENIQYPMSQRTNSDKKIIQNHSVTNIREISSYILEQHGYPDESSNPYDDIAEDYLFNLFYENHIESSRKTIPMYKMTYKQMKVANQFYDWRMLSRDVDLLLKIIKKNMDKQWDWMEISKNNNINIEFILFVVERLGINVFDWQYLSKNANITWEISTSFPKLPWNWSAMSNNPNITYEIVVNNPKYIWDFTELSDNHFQKNLILIKQLEKKQTRKIKYWKMLIECF